MLDHYSNGEGFWLNCLCPQHQQQVGEDGPLGQCPSTLMSNAAKSKGEKKNNCSIW